MSRVSAIRAPSPVPRILLSASLFLAACSPSSETPAKAPIRAPNAPLAAAPPTDLPKPDRCGALERQRWVGESVDDLPDPPTGATWRVICTTCDRTDDFMQDRLNIDFDKASRRVVSLSCG